MKGEDREYRDDCDDGKSLKNKGCGFELSVTRVPYLPFQGKQLAAKMMRADSSLQPGQANSSSTSSSSPEPLQLTPSPEPLPPTTLRTSAWLEAREGYAAAMSNACDHHSMKQVVSYCDDVLILPATEQEPPVHRVLEPVPGTSRISSPLQRTEASAKCSSIQNGAA
ncbi:hypothetical protein DPMN_122178 [Dreissena polymorpha]|uniref:Uncharacterized protein n=1 Tax=Dreissena polymorpha TaxID=45954 RepID=A0A9D4JU84_DREPO|nr:hypothetical protein DPMN_122178 [Dreissena polymorpha]